MEENINVVAIDPFIRAEDGKLEECREGRPKEPRREEYEKSIVYAGLDAIITSSSLISSISSGRLSSVDVLVLGFAYLVADGISMGFEGFMSSSTEMDVAAKERMVTEWKVTNHQRLQEQQLLQRYMSLGMNMNDATMVVNILAKYRDILIDEKMAKEKGFLPPDQTEAKEKWFGHSCRVSCIWICTSFSPFTQNETQKFIGACLLSALALVLLGAAKAKITCQNYALSAANTVFNGAIAGAAAYANGLDSSKCCWLRRLVD